MLVLSRKLDEVICIGDDIEIRVIRIGNGAVRLGIEAPREVSIVRAEILGRYPKADSNDSPRGAGEAGSLSAASPDSGELSDQTLRNYCQRRQFRRMLKTESTSGQVNAIVGLN